ncbi:MAG: selenide,water dikinase [Bradymonadia bacterium]
MQILAGLPTMTHPAVVVGSGTLDDAAVTRWPGSDDLLIQTIDVITPVVDDPYVFGQIAAANALSDVYAMGGTPMFALAFAAFPGAMDTRIAARILEGGAAAVGAAGAIIVGGHTLKDDVPKYGLAVVGRVREPGVRTNAGGRAGDALVLTKPLGGGLAYSAYRAGTLGADAEAAWIANMLQLNDGAARACASAAVHAVTDVTGFGLLGHAVQLAKASGVGLHFETDAIPLLPGTLARAQAAGLGGGAGRNWRYAAPDLPETPMVRVLADPQTSGGLLIAVAPTGVDALLAALRAQGVDGICIGALTDATPGAVRLSPGDLSSGG